MSAEIVQFIPKPNPNRDAMIREARSIYDGIFPVDYTQVVDTAPCEYVAPESDPA